MKRLFLLLTLALVVMSCEQVQDFIDTKGHELVFLEGEMKAYFDDKGDTKNYKFKADLAWSAEVSADWVVVNPTSGEAGENKIQIKVDKNNSTERRTGYVDIILSNEQSYRIELEQLAAGENLDDVTPPVSIPSNEIWYTSTDGNIVEPYSGEYNENADILTTFGVNIVSNTYVDGKGVIVFDGDVTMIGGWAFAFCENLKNITFPKGLSIIGNQSFWECRNLIDVIIPDSITEIWVQAFYCCSSITEITIPDSVTLLGNGAFGGCSSLKEFKGKYAADNGRCLIDGNRFVSYAGASGTEYTVPEGVTEITGHAFADLDIQKVVIPEGVTEIGRSAFITCESLADVSLPQSLKIIGDHAFRHCYSLTNLTIPSLTHMGTYTFAQCRNLESVMIGDGLTMIGEATFWDCVSLTSITIPDSVTTIGDYAFHECTSLTSVTMGKGVETVGGYAFMNCSSLNAVHISDLTLWCNIDFVNPISNGFSLVANPLYYARNLYLNGELITELVIPESVTEIKFLAFTGCSASNIVFHDNVKSIGPCAFERSENIENLVIGNGVEYIGNVAFGRCPKLTSVTMSDKLSSYGFNVFLECYNLVEFKGAYATEDGRTLTANNILLAYANASGSEYTIPDGITVIYQGAFCSCVNLRSVTIPESVTTIGYCAFGYNGNLESVYCKPTTPPSIDMYAFQYPNEDGEFVNAPCKIYVPVESYYTYTRSAAWMVYSDNLVSYNYETGELVEPEEPEFIESEYVIEYTSADGKTVIPYNLSAFGANIENITCENGEGVLYFDSPVTTIGDMAFYNRRNLSSITIPDSVTTIGEYAFSECASLSSIVIGANVQAIGLCAFAGCFSLTEIYCKSITPPAVVSWMFEHNSGLVIYVPTESVEAYKSAEYWSGYANAIVGYDF